jgi:HD-like signal output (HDOD) protein
VRLVLGLLGGIACAHAQGVVHRDLKPSNVMLTASGVPRSMDFGVATRVQQRGGDELLYGTPSYMAPEYVRGAPYTPACDLFSLGMLLYELLVGAPAVRERDPAATLRRMRVGLWPRPSERVAGIDARLDRLVMQAIAAEPAERYADAATFAAALGEYLDPVPSRGEDDGARSKQATLDFLLRRMRHGSDFPALSATIGSVNHALAAENERASVLCNTILKDFALTNKLLKLVNAAYYNSFGGRVSTVSRAVAILGFDGVRNVALSLVLLEHLQNKSQAAALREEVGATYSRGVIARQLGRQLGTHEAESLFICAMFHRLGKLLAMFYLHEEAQAIVRLCEARGIDEMRASAEVLGISYEELGIGVAREWKFPDLIIDSMRHVANPLRGRAVPASERQRVLSAVADEAYDISLLPQDHREAVLTVLARKFDCGLGISEKALRTAMNEAATEVSRDAALLGMSVAHPRTSVAGDPGQMAITDAAHANSFDAMVADATHP